MPFRRLLESLRPEVSGARALEHVRAIAAHHRIQATPGYDAAASWLARAAAQAGLAVDVVEVPADGRTAYLGCVMPEGWACERASATLVSSGTREALCDFGAEPLSLIQRSTSAAGAYRLVRVEDGTRPGDYEGLDVRGCIVLTDGAVQRVHRLAVRERGAAGVLSFGRRLLPPVRTREVDRDSIAYTSFWWAGDEPRGWGFAISPARGDALAARLRAGEALSLEVEIDARRFATRIPIVTATLPGDVDAEVLLTAHLCHPRPGANDNASGVAAVLEAMAALAALDARGGWPRPRRTVRAVWMPELTGTYAWLGGDRARADRTLAALNLDMVGEDQLACGSVQLLERAPHFAGSFADALLRDVRHAALPAATDAAPRVPQTAEVPYSGGSDHAIWIDPAIGVPCPLLIQWPDRYYHSSLDTLERCDPASLAHAALCAAAYAGWLATAFATEIPALAAQLERSAVRDLRLALDAAEPARAVRAARWRAQLALASLERFALGEGADGPVRRAVTRAVAHAAEAVEGTCETEIVPALGASAFPVSEVSHARVPMRLQRSPLALMRVLQVGWPGLAPGLRARWETLEDTIPGGSTALDLAWFACDGRRSVGEIAERLADEGTAVAPGLLETFFDLTEALGVSAWRPEGRR